MKNFRLAAVVAVPFAGWLLSSSALAATPDAVFAMAAPPADAVLTAVSADKQMGVVLSIPMRDRAGAEAYAAAVSQPGNALYGKFLTPAQFGARFGGDAANYAYVRNWAAAQGLAVGEPMDARTSIAVTGTAAQFARLFSTSFASFPTPAHGDGQVMLTAPTLPSALAGRVEGVIGLSSAGHFGLMLHAKPAGVPNVGTGLGGGYAPSDVRTAYAVPAQVGASTETVAVFAQGGFFPIDVTTYQAQYKLPAIPVTARSVNGASTKPIANGVDIEAALDIDAITGMNPAVKQIIMYEDGKDDFSTALVNSFNAIAQDDTATVVNVSYGQDEIQQGTPGIKAENTALMQLVTQGQTVFISSGDDGAAGRTGSGLNAPDPGSQPLVTSVGGTRLNTNPSTQVFKSETVWNDLANGHGATGGGVSSVWSIPSWQVVNGTSVAVANGGSSTHRNVPDIAADADPYTAYSIYSKSSGGWVAYGGTSLAAPLWSGMATIINANRVKAGKARLGFFNPLLYSLGVGERTFHDTKVGTNGSPGYKAGKGYDNTTGFGSVNLTKFLPIVSK